MERGKANRLAAVINHPWITDIEDITERKMIKKMDSIYSDFIDPFVIRFDNEVFEDEYNLKIKSVAYLNMRFNDRISKDIALIRSAYISNDNFVMKLDNGCDDMELVIRL